MVYVEHEGALFRGPARAHPEHVWHEGEGAWKPYSRDVPKGPEWGNIVSEQEARLMMGEMAAAL